MRQASWEELFRKEDQVAEKPSFWARVGSFVTWEELITLLIVLIAFLTVVQSIDSADWVPEMPSLYGVAFLGLLTGLILARLHIHEAVAHLLALAVGAAGVVYASVGELEGPLPDRVSELWDRVYLWGEALYTAVHMLNRTHDATTVQTLFECWFSKPATLVHVHMFGC